MFSCQRWVIIVKSLLGCAGEHPAGVTRAGAAQIAPGIIAMAIARIVVFIIGKFTKKFSVVGFQLPVFGILSTFAVIHQ